MADRPVMDLRLGDHLALRKRHPCGSTTWRIVRVGADIGLVCDGCGRRVLLERRDVERRIVRFLERGDAAGAQEAPGGRESAELPPDVTASSGAGPRREPHPGPRA